MLLTNIYIIIKLQKNGIIKSGITGGISGLVGNVVRIKSTIKRGQQYIERGSSMLQKYAVNAGKNSGIGGAIGSILGWLFS